MPYAVIRYVATWLVVLAATAGCVPSQPESSDDGSVQAFERNRKLLSKPTAGASAVRPGDDGREAIRTTALAPGFTFGFRLYRRQGMDPNVPAVYEKVASGDFNGDGRRDLVFGMESNEIELVFQNATGGAVHSPGMATTASRGYAERDGLAAASGARRNQEARWSPLRIAWILAGLLTPAGMAVILKLRVLRW